MPIMPPRAPFVELSPQFCSVLVGLCHCVVEVCVCGVVDTFLTQCLQFSHVGWDVTLLEVGHVTGGGTVDVLHCC